MSAGIITVRNINQALNNLKNEPVHEWRNISPRGMATLEFPGPLITEYLRPDERVLFSQSRDANPFFHFIESLWILAGRRDVKFLAEFNKQIAEYSDDGEVFHAAYGYRLRKHFEQFDRLANDRAGSVITRPVDQVLEAIKLLKKDHATRQVVLSIWDPAVDLGAKTKDMPCNDLIMLKVRDGKLNITVCCRSNDAIWGAYGANVVQFSVLQEFIARSVGVGIGTYRQLSDSFHIYVEQEAWLRTKDAGQEPDLYETQDVRPFPLMLDGTDPQAWLAQCSMTLDGMLAGYEMADPFFTTVASPIIAAWRSYKREDGREKNERIDQAQNFLDICKAEDWAIACHRWLERRREA